MKRTKSSAGHEGEQNSGLGEALLALGRGDVIVFPTETFYGLGANALDTVAVNKVVALKGRDPKNPIPVIVGDRAMLGGIIMDPPMAAVRLMDLFWPGPLTLVLAARQGLPAPLLNQNGGVGVRISSHPLAAQLVKEFRKPLTATSANPSGREPARTRRQAVSYFSEKLKIFLDGGELKGTKGSTVVEVVDGKLKILREGEISTEKLRGVITLASL
jgi:L-threonylcarbamoyladenylate synthase